MNITILNVVVSSQAGKKPGTSYQLAEVAYKNNTFGGKVEGKKITQYSKVYKIAAEAQAGESYDVTSEKNEGGFNEWVSMVKAGGPVVAPVKDPRNPAPSTTPAPAGRGFETPEERAKKQVYIVRQSSLSNAIAALSVGAKVKLSSAEIIAEARKFEEYVFNLGGSTGFDDMPALDPSFGADPQID